MTNLNQDASASGPVQIEQPSPGPRHEGGADAARAFIDALYRLERDTPPETVPVRLADLHGLEYMYRCD